MWSGSTGCQQAGLRSYIIPTAGKVSTNTDSRHELLSKMVGRPWGAHEAAATCLLRQDGRELPVC